MVHHASVALRSAAWRGPAALYRGALRSWLRWSYDGVDGVMAACDPWEDTGRSARLRLRFGVDPAFRPLTDTRRGGNPRAWSASWP